MDLSTLLLVGLILVASGASRRWRWQTPPWGVTVLAAAIVSGRPPATVAALAVLAAAVEVLGRPTAARQVLPALVAVAGLAPILPTPASTGAMVGVVVLLLATAAAAPGLLRVALPHHRRRAFDSWSHAAASLVLLAPAVLIADGLRVGEPVRLAVGGAVVFAAPLLISRLQQRASRSLRLQSLAELARTLTEAASPHRGGDLEAATRRLHSTLAPVVGHDVTVLALHPLVRLHGPTVAAHPLDPDQLPGVQERAGNLFASRRRTDRSGAAVVTPEQARSLHPGFPYQLLIPVSRGRQRLGFVGLLGEERRLAASESRELTEALATFVRHLVDVVDLAERAELLGQRAEQQRERLRILLHLHRSVITAPDLAAVCHALLRAVVEAFTLPVVSLLMRTGRGTWRVAAEHGMPGASELDILGSALEAALALGRPVSRCRVVPSENWPLGNPGGEDVPYLVALPVTVGGELLAVLTASPAPGEPLPDLDELRLLELFVEQSGPVLQSAVHLEEVQRQTLLDGLTGVANRRALDHAVEHALRQAHDHGARCSVAMVDVDDFKAVNDRYGHGIGDVVLSEIARLLGHSVRAQDVVGRYGGEEFCIVLPEQDGARAAPVLERVRQAVATTSFAGAELTRPVGLTVSIGCATYPEDGATAKTLLERADLALYRAKRTGKNRLVCAAELTDPGLARDEEPFAF